MWVRRSAAVKRSVGLINLQSCERRVFGSNGEDRSCRIGSWRATGLALYTRILTGSDTWTHLEPLMLWYTSGVFIRQLTAFTYSILSSPGIDLL